MAACALGCQSVPQAQSVGFLGFVDEAAANYESQAATKDSQGDSEVIQLKAQDCTMRVLAVRFGPTPTCQRALQQARDDQPSIRFVRNLSCREEHTAFKQCVTVTGKAYQ